MRYPELKKVKTRLAKDLGYEKSTQLYKSMSELIVKKLLDSNEYEILIFYTPSDKEKKFKLWLKNKRLNFFPQVGNTFAEKISNSIKSVFSSDAEKVVIVGTDCIQISSEDIVETLDILSESNNAVIGPTYDGGFYLLGLNERYRLY